jgi:hypothetical protein
MDPAFYREISPINKERDALLKVAPVRNYRFATAENVLPAFFDEMPALVRHYPVVFTTHDVPVMVTVVGHRGNIFIDDRGAWQQEMYIPRVLRTYPFAGLQDDQGNLAFCIDRKYDGIGARTGEKVFEDAGGTFTPFGLNAARFAAAYVSSFERTREFSKKLKELELLVPASISVTKNGQARNFGGFQQVDGGAMSKLSPEALKELATSGDLYALYLHTFSLNNFSRIA